jgi:hypothetical protein
LVTGARLPTAHGGPGAAEAGKEEGRAADAKARAGILRAATGPSRGGIVYGMTQAGIMFAFDPRLESVKDLGPNVAAGDYTAVVVLSPDEKYLYYAPGSHGSDVKHGAPIVQYEIATGRRKTLAFLLAPLRERLKYTLGGTFNLGITPDGAALLGTFNGAPYDPAARKEATFGQPCLLRIGIPKSERE